MKLFTLIAVAVALIIAAFLIRYIPNGPAYGDPRNVGPWTGATE